jgi:hypothetical protein
MIMFFAGLTVGVLITFLAVVFIGSSVFCK